VILHRKGSAGWILSLAHPITRQTSNAKGA
jgi:hypothetical protein